MLDRLTHTPRKTSGHSWTLDNVGDLGSLFNIKKSCFPTPLKIPIFKGKLGVFCWKMAIFSVKTPKLGYNIVLTTSKIHFLTLFSFFHPTTFFHKSYFTSRMRYRIVNPTLTSVQLWPQVMSGVLVSESKVRNRRVKLSIQKWLLHT